MSIFTNLCGFPSKISNRSSPFRDSRQIDVCVCKPFRISIFSRQSWVLLRSFHIAVVSIQSVVWRVIWFYGVVITFAAMAAANDDSMSPPPWRGWTWWAASPIARKLSVVIDSRSAYRNSPEFSSMIEPFFISALSQSICQDNISQSCYRHVLRLCRHLRYDPLLGISRYSRSSYIIAYIEPVSCQDVSSRCGHLILVTGWFSLPGILAEDLRAVPFLILFLRRDYDPSMYVLLLPVYITLTRIYTIGPYKVKNFSFRIYLRSGFRCIIGEELVENFSLNM